MIMQLLTGFLLLAVAVFTVGNTVSEEPIIVPDFRLKSTQGTWLCLADSANANGFIVVFTCNHCPFAKQYHQRLNALHARFAQQGVPLVAISSTDTVQYADDSFAQMVTVAQTQHYQFPYLYDPTQQAARSFGAQKTPHAFVIWKVGSQWEVRYSGAIDNNGYKPDQVTQPYVQDAVEALLAGKPVRHPSTSSVGCVIHFRAAQ
jgi:peroxiredoxin